MVWITAGLMPSALGRATTLFANSGRMAGMISGLVFGLVQVLGYRYAYVGSVLLCATGAAVLALASRGSRPETATGRAG